MKKNIFIYSVSILIGLIVFISAVPPSVVSFNADVSQTINYLIPEGWAFFTKSPREIKQDLYIVENNNLRRFSYSNVSLQNLCGISRKARRIGYEMSIIHRYLPDSNWTDIKHLSTDELKYKVNDTTTIKRPEDIRFLPNGVSYLVMYNTPPWAYAKHANRFDSSFRVIAINIQ